MGKQQVDLLQGTLEMLILKAVSLGPLHGYGVLQRIEQISREQLLVQQGSLYPALARLGAAGARAREWGPRAANRRPKYYTLTARGEKQLQDETEKWQRVAKVMGAILRMTELPKGEAGA